jgi:DNA polymerase III subunit epsilon
MRIGIVDIETTNFLNAGGNIVEIGIASLDTETGEVEKCFGSLCLEEGFSKKDENAWIFSNSDLTLEEVESAPSLESIREDVQNAIDSFDAVTAFNKRFDFDFLRSRGFKIEKEWPCPMLKATPICKCVSVGRSSYKWPKVEEAWEFFFPDEPYIEAHRGLDDAMHEAKIVKKLYDLGAMTE